AELPVSSNAGDTQLPSGLGQSTNLGCIPDGRPEVTAVNKSLMAIAGRSALLAGQLCSSPRPLRVFWVLRHLVLRPGDVRHPYVAYNLTETEIPNCYMGGLELRRLQVEDSGEVLLVVKNAHGIADALFLLNVTQASSFSASHASGELYPSVLFTLLIPVCLLWLLHRAIDSS
ncbi:ig-like domain-containing protein, partial [Trichonephila clavata]